MIGNNITYPDRGGSSLGYTELSLELDKIADKAGKLDYNNTITLSEFPTSSAQYTTPSDGCYFCAFNINEVSTYQLFINGVARLTRGTHTGYKEDQSIMTIPLSKGDVIYWSGTPTTIYTNVFVPVK